MKFIKQCIQKLRQRLFPDPMKEFRDGKGKQFSIGGGWGCRIEWVDYEKLSVCGWLQNKPKKGDWLLCEMKSGKTAVFRFIEIEHCRDPHDMFFATVEACGYKGGE